MDNLIPITSVDPDPEQAFGADLNPYRFFDRETIEFLDEETIQILIDDKIATGG